MSHGCAYQKLSRARGQALRWGPQGYILLLSAGRGDKVRAEPFDAIELPVGVLFGDDEE